MDEQIRQLLQYIDESERIVFFGGAGVSTESGIPDFRSKDGLYNNRDVNFASYNPEYLLSLECLAREPKVFYEFYRQKLDTRNIEPNIAHRVLAKLEEIGKLSAVVTQNIDGLHQKAGSKKVFEIHGTTQRNYCIHCKKEYDAAYIFESKEKVPKCECGGKIRPDVTLYGEQLSNDAVSKAIDALHHADMMIVAGTSLQVYPAAGLIHHFHGEHLVVLNREPVNVILNPDSDLWIGGNMGDVFREIEKHLEKK